jgi:hypothetical protein
VRARLSFGEGTAVRGTRMGVIYVELQNLFGPKSFDSAKAIYYDAANLTNPLETLFIEAYALTDHVTSNNKAPSRLRALLFLKEPS